MPATAHTSSPRTEDFIGVGDDQIAFRSTCEQSGGALISIEIRMPPGGGPPALHRHKPAELYRVESGELTFYLEADNGTIERTVTSPGHVVTIPGGREHTIRNESHDEARAFVVFAPGSEIEEFVRTAAELTRSGSTSIGDLLRAAAAHGIEITRPVEEIA